MKKQIAILDRGYDSYELERHLFSRDGYELIIYEGPRADRMARYRFARTATGILVRDTLIDEDALLRMPRLKAIVRYGVGFDNIHLGAARQRGIRVANVQGYANHAVSDHALALMLACTRGITLADPSAFGTPRRKEILELHDKTLGIIGIGRIGSHFAMKASPLFRVTLAYDPYQSAPHMRSHGAVKSGFDELLRESHVISLHCNLTEETRHLLNDAAFQKMEKVPVIINTARGAVILEQALLRALESGTIHSAGLDVYEEEPPGKGQQPLLSHPHVVSTSHVAWYSENSMQELQRRAAQNMADLLAGRSVSDEITSP